MRVFWIDGTVVNVSNDCPSVGGLVENGEEIPIDIFGDYPNFADNTNTTKVGSEWVFDFDAPSQKKKDRIADIEAEVKAEMSDHDEEIWTAIKALGGSVPLHRQEQLDKKIALKSDLEKAKR